MTHLGDGALERLRTQLGTPSRVAGRYALAGLLGRGGMGEVHRAHDEHLGRTVALKLLARDVAATKLAGRLAHEARVLARLEHPGIVPLYDAGALDDGRVYYVMRLVEGVRLDQYARSGVSRGELLRTLRRVAEAVAFAHERGVVHRDLKPGNVMIGPFGEVLVLDWGIAQVLAEAGPGDGAGAGTPGYMAPEQAAGGPVDIRTDVFALGVILGELLAVHPEPPGRALSAVVARATAAEPGLRYATVPAFAEDLRRWLDGEPVSAHREGPLERAWRFARRHQVAILLLLTYAIVRMIILLWRGI